MHEFERKRFQRISAKDHPMENTDTNSIMKDTDSIMKDTNSIVYDMYKGMAANVKSRNDIAYYNNPPEQVYL